MKAMSGNPLFFVKERPHKVFSPKQLVQTSLFVFYFKPTDQGPAYTFME